MPFGYCVPTEPVPAPLINVNGDAGKDVLETKNS